MLSAATMHLCRCSHRTTIIGRSESRLSRFRSLGEGVEAKQVDYTDIARLEEELNSIRARAGAPDLAVCWVHSTAPQAIDRIAEITGSNEKPGRFFHVQGSAIEEPGRRPSPSETRLRALPNVIYRQVILGFAGDHGNSRWLSHEEISVGLIEAVQLDSVKFIVGRVRPWSDRP